MFASFARTATVRLVALGLAMLVSIPTYAGDLKQNQKIPPGLPATSDPSGAAAVDRLMHPKITDPSVPLQNPDLADKPDPDQPLQKPQIYGRGEQGGQNGSVLEGLLGIRIPFPAARSNTTSSVGDSGGGPPGRSP